MASLSKFPDGKTKAEHLAEVRTHRKTAKAQRQEELRHRDGRGCRWPGCECRKQDRPVIEAAHLWEARGMGGDPKLIRSGLENQMRLCFSKHRGARSLHSTHLEIRPLTRRKANGPCAFYQRETLDSPWELVAAEDEATFARQHKRKFEETDEASL